MALEDHRLPEEAQELAAEALMLAQEAKDIARRLAHIKAKLTYMTVKLESSAKLAVTPTVAPATPTMTNKDSIPVVDNCNTMTSTTPFEEDKAHLIAAAAASHASSKVTEPRTSSASVPASTKDGPERVAEDAVKATTAGAAAAGAVKDGAAVMEPEPEHGDGISTLTSHSSMETDQTESISSPAPKRKETTEAIANLATVGQAIAEASKEIAATQVLKNENEEMDIVLASRSAAAPEHLEPEMVSLVESTAVADEKVFAAEEPAKVVLPETTKGDEMVVKKREAKEPVEDCEDPTVDIYEENTEIARTLFEPEAILKTVANPTAKVDPMKADGKASKPSVTMAEEKNEADSIAEEADGVAIEATTQSTHSQPQPIPTLEERQVIVSRQIDAALVRAKIEKGTFESILDGVGMDRLCGVDDRALGLTATSSSLSDDEPVQAYNPTKLELTHEGEVMDLFGPDHDALILCGKVADICDVKLDQTLSMVDDKLQVPNKLDAGSVLESLDKHVFGLM